MKMTVGVLNQTIWQVRKFGQDRMFTLYMTIYLVNSLPKIPYIHRIHILIYVALANPQIRALPFKLRVTGIPYMFYVKHCARHMTTTAAFTFNAGLHHASDNNNSFHIQRRSAQCNAGLHNASDNISSFHIQRRSAQCV